MKNILLTFSAIFLIQFSGFAQEWKPTTATVTFKIKHALGAYADGKFGGLSASVKFDADNPASGLIYASIQSQTIDTDNGLRDKELKSDDYFDVANYPKITMKSTSIQKGSGANAYIGIFDVTIKNKTKSMKVPFVFTQFSNEGTFTAQFTIDRTEFGVGEASKLLSSTAKVTLKLNVVQK